MENTKSAISFENSTFIEAVRGALFERAKACSKDGETISAEWQKTIESFCGQLYCENGAVFTNEGARAYCEIFGLSAEEFIERIANNDATARRYCAQKALLKFSFIIQALAGATDDNLTAYARRFHKKTLCDAHTHNFARVVLRLSGAENAAVNAADLKAGLGYKWGLNRAVTMADISELPEYQASTTNTQNGQINSILQCFTDSRITKRDADGNKVVYEGRRAVQADTDTIEIDPRFIAVLASIGKWKQINSNRF